MIDEDLLLEQLDIIKYHDNGCNGCVGECTKCEYSLAIDALENVIYNYCSLMKAFNSGALLQKCETVKYGSGIYMVGGESYYTVGCPVAEAGD